MAEKSDTREVPTKKRKRSKTKHERNIRSSSAVPNMLTVHGTIYPRNKDRNEVKSDSDDECAISGENSAEQTCRSESACDRYERPVEIEEGSNDPSIVDFSVRSRSSLRNLREDRLSIRKIGEALGSRSMFGNNRRPRRGGFAERMLRLNSTSALSLAITQTENRVRRKKSVKVRNRDRLLREYENENTNQHQHQIQEPHRSLLRS